MRDIRALGLQHGERLDQRFHVLPVYGEAAIGEQSGALELVGNRDQSELGSRPWLRTELLGVSKILYFFSHE